MTNYTPDECEILLEFAENLKIMATLAKRNTNAGRSVLRKATGLDNDRYDTIIEEILHAKDPDAPYKLKPAVIDNRWLANAMGALNIKRSDDNGYTADQIIRFDRVLLSIPDYAAYKAFVVTYAGRPPEAKPRPGRPDDNGHLMDTAYTNMTGDTIKFINEPSRMKFIEAGETDLIGLVNQYGHTSNTDIKRILETLATIDVFVIDDLRRFTPSGLRASAARITNDRLVANTMMLITTTRPELFLQES